MRVKYVGHGITERAVEDIDFLKDESVDLAARASDG
jgi:hypothetical protein